MRRIRIEILNNRFLWNFMLAINLTQKFIMLWWNWIPIWWSSVWVLDLILRFNLLNLSFLSLHICERSHVGSYFCYSWHLEFLSYLNWFKWTYSILFLFNKCSLLDKPCFNIRMYWWINRSLKLFLLINFWLVHQSIRSRMKELWLSSSFEILRNLLNDCLFKLIFIVNVRCLITFVYLSKWSSMNLNSKLIQITHLSDFLWRWETFCMFGFNRNIFWSWNLFRFLFIFSSSEFISNWFINDYSFLLLLQTKLFQFLLLLLCNFLLFDNSLFKFLTCSKLIPYVLSFILKSFVFLISFSVWVDQSKSLWHVALFPFLSEQICFFSS